jgi:aromatic ring-opening dioxygenase LigB subunit
MDSGLKTAVLMCHAPIVLPEIAGEATGRVRASTVAMQAAAKAVLAARPQVLAIVSPHTPRHRKAFGVSQAARLQGDFGGFGFPELTIDLPGAPEAADSLMTQARKLGVTAEPLPSMPLDHGAMVPLHFLQQAGWSGPTLLLALPGHSSLASCESFGQALLKTAEADAARPWALVASGDMSHRLIASAPAGYHPRARDFDAHITRFVEAGRYREALAVDPELRELAAEDVVESLAVACGAVAAKASGHRFLSYEGPFGVGYLVSILFEAGEGARA